MHITLIVLHAGCGLAALVAAWIAIRRRGGLGIFFWSLVGCIGFLAAVVAFDWSSLGAGARVGFSAFVILGGYMIWHAQRARALWPAVSAAETQRLIDHLGFTIVALVDAFVVITVLDLGAPGWLAALVGVAGAVAGHLIIRRIKSNSVAAAG